MSQEVQWYVSQEGEQLGPYTDEQMLSFAQGGNIIRETLVWAEGMAEWLPASQIEGLFPPLVAPAPATPAPGRGAPATARPGPGGPARPATVQAAGPVRAGGPATARSGPVTATATARPGQATATAHAAQGRPAHGGFPRVAVEPASFGLFAGFLISPIVLGALALAFMFQVAKQPQPDPNTGIVIMALFGVAGACLLVANVLGLMYLYRGWKSLARAGASVTPGMAIGLLFVPLFNVYWLFRAWYGFAQDWNHLTAAYEDSRRGPRMPEGLYLTFCISALIVPPLNLILIFPVMASLCKAINFMARRPVAAKAAVRR